MFLFVKLNVLTIKKECFYHWKWMFVFLGVSEACTTSSAWSCQNAPGIWKDELQVKNKFNKNVTYA